MLILEVDLINIIPDPLIHPDFDNVYYPSDDSYLIIDYFKKNVCDNYFDGIKIEKIGRILDLGTGTGVIAIFMLYLRECYTKFNAKIYASDILKEALACAKMNEELNNFKGQIQFFHSNLFSSFPDTLKHAFDMIIFNPPYLPSSNLIDISQNSHKIDYSWDGGAVGSEVILDFLEKAKDFLNISPRKKSYLYFISSSRTDLKELEINIIKKGFKNTIVEKKHVFFEDIILNRVEII